MLWILTPPWGRWLVALLIVVAALWVEFRPDPMVDHPFAMADIAPGTPVGDAPVELRRVPADLFDPIDPNAVVTRQVRAGEPLLASRIATEGAVPADWWMVEVGLPGSATVGDTVGLLLLDSGRMIEGVVAGMPSDDPFGSGMGAVAVNRTDAVELAGAVAEGRVVVMVQAH